MNKNRDCRLASLSREARWDIPAHDMVALAKFQDQQRLNNIGGLVDLIFYVMDKLGKDPLNQVAEIGCHYGVSTECLALFCNNLFAVDPWPIEWVYEHFMFRMSAYNHVTIQREESPGAANVYGNGLFDLVYIDGMHTQKAVEADIRAWLPKIKPGGFIAGHDYAEYPPSNFMYKVIQVIPAVNATLGKPDMVFSDSSWLKRV